MTIIDSHAHLGECNVFGLSVSEDDLIRAMDANQVEVSIVQPFPGAPDPVAVHRRIYELSRKYPGRIFGVASVSPHLPADTYRDRIRQAVEEFGFVGVKLHTIGHAVMPLTPDARKVFQVAGELGIAVNIHTGPGIPFSLPSLCIPLCRQFPEIPVVFAHSGAGILTMEAMVAAELCPNIYLETSWCSVDDIGTLIGRLGSGRIMMGSDGLANLGVELAKYHNLSLADKDRDLVLGGVAARAFKLPVAQ